MLATVKSRELTKWAAFEREYGPLGQEYTSEVLASIQEELQFIAHILGAAHLADEGKKNPIPAPKRIPRPHELADMPAPQQEQEEQSSPEETVAALDKMLGF